MHDPAMRSITWIESRRKLNHELFTRAPVRQIHIVSRVNEGVCSDPPPVDIDLLVGRVCFTGEKEIEEREVVGVKCDIGTFEKAIRLGVVEKVRRGRHGPSHKDAWSRSTLPVWSVLVVFTFVAPRSTAPRKIMP